MGTIALVCAVLPGAGSHHPLKNRVQDSSNKRCIPYKDGRHDRVIVTNDMNVLIFWICVAIGTIVYAIIIWSLVVYRKSREQEDSFHKSTAAEIAWTVIPLLIIIAMTIPAAKLLTRIYQGGANDYGAIYEMTSSAEMLAYTATITRENTPERKKN